MNTHPTHEELFDAAADGATGPHGPHLDACADCRAAYARLRAEIGRASCRERV